MPATKRHAATPKPTSATDAIRKANLAMAEEDGLPPGMRPTTTEAPQPEANVAKMTVEQAKKIRKLSKMAGFDPEEWLKIPRTAEEGKGMLKYLTAKLGPDAMAFANGPSAV